MPAITIIICTHNAADTLEAACRSATWADELLVVDSGSTDGSDQIAQTHADRFIHEPWRGYTQQKVFAAEQARNDWIFILDSDEEISPELAKALQQLDDATLERIDMAYVRRKHYVMGRPVRAWSPDWLSRLMHRGRIQWSDDALHDARIPSDPKRTLRITQGHLEHKRLSTAGWSDYFSGRRMDERLWMVAEQMHDRGKRCHPWDLVLRPWAAFLKSYVIKRGFFDGTFGLLIAQKSAVSTQLKYAALWAVQKQRSEKSHGSDSGGS